MSRHPVHYEYPTPPENNYYLEEFEGCNVDYSDNDCGQEHLLNVIDVPATVKRDYYGRNPTIVPIHLISRARKVSQRPPKHLSEQYVQQHFYTPNMLCPNYCDLKNNCYPLKPSSPHDQQYQKSYQSHYDNVDQFRPMTTMAQTMDYPIVVHKPVATKRFPITVPTPKFYKKPPTNAVYRRPSALCIPGASQPDPAVIHRPKRIPVFTDNFHSRMPEFQGDTVVRHTFDDMFEQMEKGVLSQKNDNKNETSKMAKFLKPKIPASLRGKEKLKSKIPKKTRTNASNTMTTAINSNTVKNTLTNQSAEIDTANIDEQDPTENSLEKLLNQLKKCELTCVKKEPCKAFPSNTEKQELEHKDMGRGDGEDILIDDEKFNLNLNSYNYQDIRTNIERSKCDGKNTSETNSIQGLTTKINSSLSNSSEKPKHISSKPILDDNCALELHRSKSYIVNLIDRALSKELGTVPSHRTKREFDNMNPKKAIEMMNRHSENHEKEDDFNETMSEFSEFTPDQEELVEFIEENDSSRTKLCCPTEEPMYIKQLKKLRWGHLRHIQREVKRLEDLERFLDSCYITTIPEI